MVWVETNLRTRDRRAIRVQTTNSARSGPNHPDGSRNDIPLQFPGLRRRKVEACNRLPAVSLNHSRSVFRRWQVAAPTVTQRHDLNVAISRHGLEDE